jgi:hypothetical protein
MISETLEKALNVTMLRISRIFSPMDILSFMFNKNKKPLELPKIALICSDNSTQNRSVEEIQQK